jgi:hypothetical protein
VHISLSPFGDNCCIREYGCMIFWKTPNYIIVYLIFWQYWRLNSHLLGKCPTTWVTSSVLLLLVPPFPHRVLCFSPGPALDHDLPTSNSSIARITGVCHTYLVFWDTALLTFALAGLESQPCYLHLLCTPGPVYLICMGISWMRCLPNAPSRSEEA